MAEISHATELFALREPDYWEALKAIIGPAQIPSLEVNGHLKVALREAEIELAAAAQKHKEGHHRLAFTIAVQAALRLWRRRAQR